MSLAPQSPQDAVRPWHPQWWFRGLGSNERLDCLERIGSGATPGPSYYVLLILSTLIAAYGLLSNSTATVIGAMIVAPLMGPIVGLAMGTVLGDARMFRRSLVAEVTGVLLVILAGILVAEVAGVAQIDFSASEIAGRTRPTLYDIAIGLAAGLAGSFCLVHPGLQASVAGVAIAVALVPPLTVTGITAAGWMHSQLPFRPVFGSFMLFFANFLTIELAAGVLFYFAGFRVPRKDLNQKAIRHAIGIQAILLLGTGLFLYNQLSGLIRERTGLATSRKVLQASLNDIPGSDLDSLKAELQKNTLEVMAVVGSRTEITPSTVADMEAALKAAIDEELRGVTVHLVVRTVSSTYASAKSFLYEPKGTPPSPEQIRQQLLETALRDVLKTYPDVELGGFRPIKSTVADPGTVEASPTPQGVSSPVGNTTDGATPSPTKVEENPQQSASPTPDSSPTPKGDSLLLKKPPVADSASTWPLEVTLVSPYEFTPRLVTELEQKLNDALSSAPEFATKKVALRVRTVSVKSATSSDLLTILAPGSQKNEGNQELKALLMNEASKLPNQEVVDIALRPSDDPLSDLDFSATVRTRGPSLLSDAEVRRLHDDVVEAYRAISSETVSLDLAVESDLGRVIRYTPGAPIPEATPIEFGVNALKNEFGDLVRRSAQGSVLPESVRISGGKTGKNVTLEATVVTPKLLTNLEILDWQKTLKKFHPEIESLELRIDNRLGQVLRMTPTRAANTVKAPQSVSGP